MLPKQALHSSIYAASSPEEIDIIDPFAMSNTPSPTGSHLEHTEPRCHGPESPAQMFSANSDAHHGGCHFVQIKLSANSVAA